MLYEEEDTCMMHRMCVSDILFDEYQFDSKFVSGLGNKCMYPPPHMTCMYPPPLLTYWCSPFVAAAGHKFAVTLVFIPTSVGACGGGYVHVI